MKSGSELLIENLNFRFADLCFWGGQSLMEKGSPIFGLIDVFLINLNEIHADYASKIARKLREVLVVARVVG